MFSFLGVGTPRYVIFVYGQALKPADHSVYQGGGQYFGMVTNYAIVGEVVNRAVVEFPNQIMPPSQVVAVVPPIVTPTTNFIGIHLLPAQAPPTALVKGVSPIQPQ
jgi:hypothetical protein